MKRLLLSIILILGACGLVEAQPSTVTATKVKAGTRGTCASGTTATPIIVDSGIFYICVTNAWTAVGPAAASSITIGTSPIVSGTAGRLFYETSGNKFGEISGATSDGTTVTLTSPIVTAAAAGISLTITGTQPAGVGSGTGTAAGVPFTLTGAAGGDTSSTTANTRGGAGAGITATGGAGGQQTGAASGTARGGQGGIHVFTGGAGGNATAVTGTVPGGQGGGNTFTGGVGGTSATSTGGGGGAHTFTGGAGGVTTAAAVSGVGGGVTITAGAGGANANAAGTAGAGGDIAIQAGVAGVNSGGASAGANGTMALGTLVTRLITIGNAVAATSTVVQSPAISFSNAAYQSCTALTTNSGGLVSCTVSDAKVKQDFGIFKNGLETLRKITPETFKFQNSTQYADGGRTHLGFVAQNLQRANPLLVSTTGAGLLQPEQLAIQAITVQSVKELDAKITALTALVQAQQKEINRLRRHRK